jgi:hypothetical protein
MKTLGCALGRGKPVGRHGLTQFIDGFDVIAGQACRIMEQPCLVDPAFDGKNFCPERHQP